ncbi:MAG: hypothetical protein ACLGHN_15075 [Bacteriovoracia bacterium]
MKLVALFFAVALFWGVQQVSAQETVEVTQIEKDIIAEELEKEAESPKHDGRTKQYLKKISGAFKGLKGNIEVQVKDLKTDCADCSKQEKTKNFFKRLGRKLGKGAAWITTTTAKPFMSAAAFIKGAVEKESKNKELVALYQFFLNHEEEFNDLYLEVGTPEEMIEVMILKVEEITEKKSRIIMKDFLAHLGIEKEIPEDLVEFELTAEEIASIDPDKIDVAFINNHPEYQELRPILGDITEKELMDIVTSGYLDRAISLDNYKDAIPSLPELVGTVVGQLFVPKMALGIISNTLSGLYFTPVLVANIGTGVSTAICLQKDTQEKFKDDEDLKSFCSYVVNRSTYELKKSRAKGYVAGKKFHSKVKEKIQRMKARRAEKRKQKELEKEKKEGENVQLVPTLS